VRSLGLYRSAALPNFRAQVLPDGARLPFLSLLSRPDTTPDSSLSYMVGAAEEEYGASGGGWFLDERDGLLQADLRRALSSAAAGGRPVLVVGTAFAFVHLLDGCALDGWSVRLPEGSRVMETGGYKGRSRVLEQADLYSGITDCLGVPASSIINEYGMTEMRSQFYRSPLRAGPGRPEHTLPPWVRVRVLDPVTLEPVESGPGLLAYFDLANLGSVSSLLTEDWGERMGEGIRILGRAQGAEPRGCSLAAEELLAVAAASRSEDTVLDDG